MTPPLDGFLARETEKLRRSWDRHEAGMLRDYLVAGVEDQRINLQSILTRHFLLEALCGQRWATLRHAELGFAAVMNWFLRHPDALADAEARAAVLHALRLGADNVEGQELPAFVTRIFRELPVQEGELTVPNYLALLLDSSDASLAGDLLQSPAASVFELLWRTALASESPAAPLPKVLEPACGSANDYRFLERFGLARLLEYTGLDLSEKNVANACALFPGARFAVGNVLALDAPDGAFDHLIVHDLFEHLSPRALPTAVREVCRVTRGSLCAGFFSMAEIPDHIVRPVEEYHWNTLSLDRVRELFAAEGFDTTALHVGTFVRWLVGVGETHNPDAYTLVARRSGLR